MDDNTLLYIVYDHVLASAPFGPIVPARCATELNIPIRYHPRIEFIAVFGSLHANGLIEIIEWDQDPWKIVYGLSTFDQIVLKKSNDA